MTISKMRTLSVSIKLLFSFIVIGVIPLLIFFLIASHYLSVTLEEGEKSNLQASMQHAAAHLERNAEELLKICQDYAIWTDFYEASRRRDIPWLKENAFDWIPENFGVQAVALWDPGGSLIISNGDITGLNERDKEKFFRRSVEGSGFSAGVINLGQNIAFVAGGPVVRNDRTGPSAGTLLLIRLLTENELASIQFPSLVPILFDEERVLLSGDPEMFPPGITFSEISLPSGEGPTRVLPFKEGFLIFNQLHSPFGDIVGGLALFDSARSLNDLAKSSIWFLLIISSTLLLLSFFLAGGLSRWVLAPLSSLVTTVRRLRQGDLSARAQVQSDDSIGQLARSFNSLTDELLREKQAAEGDQTKLRTILNSISDPILIMDMEHNLLDYNPAAEDFLKEQNAWLKPGREKFLSRIRAPNFLCSGNEVQRKFENPTQGRQYIISASSLPLPGRRWGSVVSFHDVTELYLAERERKFLLEALAHDLSSPITSINAALDLSKASNDKDQAIKYYKMIQVNAMRLHGLVKNLLSLSRLEEGELRIKSVLTLPGQLLKDLRLSCLPLAESKGVNLSLNLPQDIPGVLADPLRLEEVFANLINNSLKHTPSGGTVLITAEKQEDWLHLIVEDTGSGIRKEELEKVFERFWQAENGTLAGGTGLGLYISRILVERMGGKISLQSAQGEGTRAVIELPIFAEGESIKS